MDFDIHGIITYLDSGMIHEALLKAARIPFVGEDVTMFKMKRQEYESGMSDYRKTNWISEMKVFLSRYHPCGFGGDYLSDKDKRWCQLNHLDIKRKFDKLCMKRHPVNVIIIEDNADALSYSIPLILYKRFRRTSDGQFLADIKGGVSDFIDFDSRETIDYGCKNLEFYWEITGSNIFFLFHWVCGFNVDLMDAYLVYWKSLRLQKPLYLFMHLAAHEKISGHAQLPDNCICLSDQEYTKVTESEFQQFCEQSNGCYRYDRNAVAGSFPISYREALEKLEFRQQ